MFDDRADDAVLIEVRQNELLVVPPSRMDDVHYMYTVGLSPCVGLVLWCPVTCAVGHFHGWDTIGQAESVIAHFATLAAEHPGKKKAVIVRAIGNTIKGGAWHSERMVSDLQDLLRAQGLRGDEVRPAPSGESAKVCVNLADGTIEHQFTYAPDSKLGRVAPSGYEDLPNWIARPEHADCLVIGVSKPDAGKINYERGYSRQLVENLLED